MGRRSTRVGSRDRRGGAYMLVLGASTLLLILGLAAMTVARIERAIGVDERNATAARLGATAGLEYGVAMFDGTAASRLAMPTPLLNMGTIGPASVTVDATDLVDGNPAIGEDDPVVITAAATVGSITFRSAAAFVPVFGASSRLGYGVAARNGIVFDSVAAFSSGGWYAGGNTSTAGTATIAGDVFATGAITGATYQGARSAGFAPLKTIDDAVFDVWVKQATAIPFGVLNRGVLEKCVLGPGTNPFGAGSPTGVYVVDCGGQDVAVGEVRVRGVLILLDTGAGSKIARQVSMEPASEGTPTLLVRGPMTFEMDGAELSEPAFGMNFNPVGAPYDGVTDNDKGDLYANVLTGVVYVSGDLTTTGKVMVDGVLLCGGTLTVKGTFSVWHRPPSVTIAGFREFSKWSMDRSTLKRIVE